MKTVPEITLQPQLPSNTKTGGKPRSAVLLVLRFLAVLTLFLVPFAELAEAKGLIGSGHGSGNWIEICSDDGVRYILVDDEGEVPASSTDDCTCLLCTCCPGGLTGSAGMQPPGVTIEAFVSFARNATPFTPGTVPVPAEQYWAASRGPPDPKENNL